MNNDKPNFLRHLVTDEAGATSLLATLLDPVFEHPLRLKFVAHMRTLLHEAKVDVPDTSPSHVVCEYEAIDLVLAWGNWIVAIENKIAAASITRGQLNRYYKKLIRNANKRETLGIPTGAARICIVFLTPTPGVGGTEFNALDLDRDRKDGRLHISWSELLEWLDSHCSQQPDDPYARIVHDGSVRVRAIIDNRYQTKTVDDENRRGMKALMSEVKNSIRTTLAPNTSMKLTDWRDPRMDELYTGIAGGNANVFFRIYAEDTDCADGSALDVDTVIEFKVAHKAPASLKRWFGELDYPRLSRLIGVAEDTVTFDADRSSFLHRQQLQGARSDLADHIASTFVRFVCMFESLIQMREGS